MKEIPGPSGGGDLEAFHTRCVLSRESMLMSLISTFRKLPPAAVNFRFREKSGPRRFHARRTMRATRFRLMTTMECPLLGVKET